MSPRKALFQLHWIVGITVGVILGIVGATGALLSFEQEIVASLARDGRQVEANGRTALAPAELLARIAASDPQKHIAGVSVVREATETVRVTFAPREQRYVDPYTGALLAPTSSGAETFFRNVRQLHRWLMLGELGDRDIGRQIVGASTMLLIFMALTGLYLRWPRGPAARRWQTWLIPDFRLKGRAFLWNLHSIMGTWVLPIYLVIALTGLQWSYEWYRDGLPVHGAGAERPQQSGKDRVSRVAQRTSRPSHARGKRSRARRPDSSRSTSISPDGRASRSSFAISTGKRVMSAPSIRWRSTARAESRVWNATTTRNSVRSSSRASSPLHSGSYFGVAGVIVFLLASLAMPVFSVTGWIMYLQRRAPRARRTSLATVTEEAS